MALNPANSNDADGSGCCQGMGEFPGGPGRVDQGVRHGVQMCWMLMPPALRDNDYRVMGQECRVPDVRR